MRSPEEELAALEASHLRRRLRRIESAQGPQVEMEGRSYLNFSSNDYLGLASHPEVAEAFAGGVRRHGAGSGASRLVCGNLAPHAELEEALAALKGTEAALAFSSGYAAALGVIPALAGKGDAVILDKLCHASLIDGARLSGAALRVYPHNDLGKLERLLQWAERRPGARDSRVLVVTESVFSMDGDLAALAGIVELKEKHGAWLLLDEAHAFGVMGPRGQGLGAELGLEAERVDLQMGTLSKAAGLSGGYLCARRAVVDLLVNRARSFIYSTAPPPAVAVAALAALAIIGGEEGASLRLGLRHHRQRLAGLTGLSSASAIFPVILGSNEAALAGAERLKQAGYLAPAIRYPTVPRGQARLRVTLSAVHAAEQVEGLGRELAELLQIGDQGEAAVTR